MGIYVFKTKFLMEQLRRDADEPESSRDFGKDIIPYIVQHGKAVAHRFAKSCVRSISSARPTGATSALSTPTGKPIST
jgi:glucose-1-phosphate adenylyltransferase